MNAQAPTGTQQDAPPDGHEVLVLTHDELETAVVERQFEHAVDAWHVAVKCLHGDNEHAAGEADVAICELREGRQ